MIVKAELTDTEKQIEFLKKEIEICRIKQQEINRSSEKLGIDKYTND